ncbi:MAG: FHA domain-containing protein [Aggregatilineales bacterium]
MSNELVLFLLRLFSGSLLLALLLLVFIVLWREYQRAVQQAQSTRRSYGKLTLLHEFDNGRTIAGQSYPLLPLTSLGRSPTNVIKLDDTFASSEHAIVAMRNGQWWLEDRQSRNGTTVNGVPVNQAVIITDGDIIGIGKYRFRLDLEQ